MKAAAVAVILAGAAHAGPAISCQWVAVPGSVFETLAELRDAAMRADDSLEQGRAARARLAQLKAAAKPGDPLSLLKAGFWTTTMHDIRIAEDSDGPGLIARAAALQPGDAEYQVLAALAYYGKDAAKFHQYWSRAQQLAKPGSAAAVNIRAIRGIYKDEID
jgi:hypothetical protein